MHVKRQDEKLGFSHFSLHAILKVLNKKRQADFKKYIQKGKYPPLFEKEKREDKDVKDLKFECRFTFSDLRDFVKVKHGSHMDWISKEIKILSKEQKGIEKENKETIELLKQVKNSTLKIDDNQLMKLITQSPEIRELEEKKKGKRKKQKCKTTRGIVNAQIYCYDLKKMLKGITGNPKKVKKEFDKLVKRIKKQSPIKAIHKAQGKYLKRKKKRENKNVNLPALK